MKCQFKLTPVRYGLNPYIDNMNDEILIDHDRLHHITFDPHEIVICIRCLLTLHYLSSLFRVTSCLNKG